MRLCENCKMGAILTAGLCIRCYKYKLEKRAIRPPEIYNICQTEYCKRSVQCYDRYENKWVCFGCMIKTGTAIANEVVFYAA